MHTHNDPVTHVGQTLSARRTALKKIVATPPTERRAQTQTLLLNAGRELIAEQGIGGTSVGDICTRAGFSRGAFYSNFTDMDHFVRKLAQDQWKTIVAAVDASLADLLASDRVPDTLHCDDVTPLAEQLLKVLPLSREFYLMQTEFSTYLARSANKDTVLRHGYAEFKQHLSAALVAGLERTGRKCQLSVIDTTDMVLACAERSMNIALANGDEDLTEYLKRILPTMLLAMTEPLR